MSEPACPSCKTPWIEHAGMIATCAELTRLRSENSRLEGENAELRAQIESASRDLLSSAAPFDRAYLALRAALQQEGGANDA